MAPHSSTLAWKIPWMEEPGRLQSLVLLRVGDLGLSDFIFTFHFHALEKEMVTHSSILAWRVPGTEEPSGLLFMGSHRVGHDWSDLAVAGVISSVYSREMLSFLPCNIKRLVQKELYCTYYYSCCVCANKKAIICRKQGVSANLGEEKGYL